MPTEVNFHCDESAPIVGAVNAAPTPWDVSECR